MDSQSQPLAVIVLAAGLGKRMVSREPKVLHRLAGLTLAEHVLRALAPLAPVPTVLVVGHEADKVRDVLGDSYGPDGTLSIQYAHQAEQLGTGHAANAAEPLLRDFRGPILLVYGDAPLLRTATLNALVGRHTQSHAKLTMLTCIAADPTGYGRVVRDSNQHVVEVVEEKSATLTQRAISEVNSGVYVFDSEWLWPHLSRVELNPVGEYYLTDLVGMAIREERSQGTGVRGQGRSYALSSTRNSSIVVTFTQEGLEEAMGINSRDQLAEAERLVQGRLRQGLFEGGVTMLMPETVYLGMDVSVGSDTVLYPGVILEGKTEVGRGCVLGPNTHIVDATVGDGSRIVSSMVEGSVVGDGVRVGPYSHLRAGTRLADGVYLGNYVEVKNSTLERGVHSGHFSYLGDAIIGENTNIGAGTVTANYDRATKSKHSTKIGRDVFIGVDTMIVAPREIGDGAATGAGSVVTKDIPPHSLAVGVPARVIKKLEGI